MPITKITLHLPQSSTYGRDAQTRQDKDLMQAYRDAQQVSKRLQSLSFVLLALAEPNANVLECFKLIAEVPEIKHYTKKKRNYSVQYLTVWEED